MLNRQKYNSLKVFYDIAKNLTDFLSKTKDNSFAKANQQAG